MRPSSRDTVLREQAPSNRGILPGEVLSVFIAPERGAPMRSVERVRAVRGRGLEGDRYFAPDGERSPGRSMPCTVTLIEVEVLEALDHEHGVRLDAAESRRNIVTRGVALNDLVGSSFRVGGVAMRGLQLCEPCLRLQQATRKSVLHGLVHRGGLRAEIVSGGTVNVGDSILPAHT